MVHVEGVTCLALAASRRQVLYVDMLLLGTSMHMCIAGPGYMCVDLHSSPSDLLQKMQSRSGECSQTWPTTSHESTSVCNASKAATAKQVARHRSATFTASGVTATQARRARSTAYSSQVYIKVQVCRG